MQWHDVFKKHPAKTNTYKTELDAAHTWQYSVNEWHDLDRDTRAMLTGKLIVERALQALQQDDAQQKQAQKQKARRR